MSVVRYGPRCTAARINRFGVIPYPEDQQPFEGMFPYDNGEWVRAKDYETLGDMCDRAQERAINLIARNAVLSTALRPVCDAIAHYHARHPGISLLSAEDLHRLYEALAASEASTGQAAAQREATGGLGGPNLPPEPKA